MAKIAVELEQALARRANSRAPGNTTARVLAQGEGWSVADVVCTCGPQDRPFEELHSHVSLAMVTAGSFQYRGQFRAGTRTELMTPGSLLLGNAGRSFECSHEHGTGDRCLAFLYAPEYFENLAADTGISGARMNFKMHRLPPLRALSPLVARACAGLAMAADMPWEELSIQLGAQILQIVNSEDLSHRSSAPPPSSVARVTRIVRMIERHRDTGIGLKLESLAREARLSSYHFLRIFQDLTGVTPHQYILRMRLLQGAMRLAAERAKVLEIAFDCGFGDVSNFNRAFRAEFGVSPRIFRRG